MNSQLNKHQADAEELLFTLHSLDEPKILFNTKVVRQGERHGFTYPDIRQALDNVDEIIEKPPEYRYENCYSVSGTTVDGLRLKIILVAHIESNRVKILNAWPE